MASTESQARLESIIHHVFLPPKVPGASDERKHKWEMKLVSTLVDSLQEFCSYEWPEAESASLELALKAVNQFKDLTQHTHSISSSTLLPMLEKLKSQESVIPLYIGLQNAGIIIRSVSEHVIFETFELSPLNEAVFATPGRLQRQFPGTTVSIPRDTLTREGFCAAISNLIEKMSVQSLEEMQPYIKKAGDVQTEDRDTVDPGVITQVLTAVLHPFGEMIPGRVLWKHTREEVRYEFGNRLPWRRSPLWLMIRVMLQLTLSEEESTPSLSDRLYKKFMVYFMAQVLKLSLKEGLSSDAIYVMNAKIARRLIKLDIKRTEGWMPTVNDTVKGATKILHQRWDEICKSDEKRSEVSRAQPKSLYTDSDSEISLPQLQRFILLQINQRTGMARRNKFIPTCDILPVREEYPPWPTDIPNTGPYLLYNLAAFENWATQCLQSWIQNNLNEVSTCDTLHRIMEEYLNVAKPHYKSQPEGMSIMILTLLEFWVACDRSAVAFHPLLGDYDPEIPIEICSSLLLRFRSHMGRVAAVEQYVQERMKKATQGVSIFSTSNSFATRFYDSSPRHQQTLRDIEKEATEQEARKRSEFRDLERRRIGLVKESENLLHENSPLIGSTGQSRVEHLEDNCQKCRLRREADRLDIEIHEWPLPSDQLKAKFVVFEIKIPEVFRDWRDCTQFMRKSVFGIGSVSTGSSYEPYVERLNKYTGLMRHADPRAGDDFQRIILVSDTKSNAISHRKWKRIAVSSEDSVCLNNGIKWEFYDQNDGEFLKETKVNPHLANNCTFSLPPSLSGFLLRRWDTPDGQGPNEVIASQSNCPDNLSLNEFKGLCSLPLGHKILWENLLRELAMPSVDWRKAETALFAWQISHQAGPPLSDSELRASHHGLKDEVLVQKLLSELTKSLDRLKENWESVPAVITFTMLTARLLSLTSGKSVDLCLTLLSSCRQTCFGWLQYIRERISSAQDEAELQGIKRRALQIALACTQTFDIDDIHLDKELQDPDAASIFLQCCMTVQETLDIHNKGETPIDTVFLISLISRHRRLLFRTKRALMPQILSGTNPGLDYAIERIWPSYRRACGANWKEQASCWLQITSWSNDGKSAVPVHFNMITCELLVSGVALARLPAHYESHKDYSVLFGRSSMQVMPSAEKGMAFSTRHTLYGHQIHLSYDLRYGDLIVRACKDNNAWELVPAHYFQKVLPIRFIQDYVHWYNTNGGVVEFRPKDQPWTLDNSSWRLQKKNSGWALERSTMVLLSPSSETTLWLSEVFRTIEERRGLHIFADQETSSIEIEIPRLQISFYIRSDSGHIMSRQYRGMCVDLRQNIGTLIGLVNKLVLVNSADSQAISVLIPDGAPQCQEHPSQNHVTVTIPSSAQKVQVYQVNNYLKCLTGNGSLRSKLFLAELHALTSGLIQDPLTSYTGTEEALRILRSEGVHSFDCLSREEVEILARISSLSPKRKFYPLDPKVMQVVEWDTRGLSPISQHVAFTRCVEGLFDQALETSFFYNNFAQPPGLDRTRLLDDRDAIRSSTFYKAFGAQSHTASFDSPYTQTRDKYEKSGRTTRLSKVAASFCDDSVQLPFQVSIGAAEGLYKKLNSFTILPPSKADGNCLSFDTKWVEKLWPNLGKEWGTILRVIHGVNPVDRLELLPWLVSVAFAKDVDDTMLSLFVGLIFHDKNPERMLTFDGPLRLDAGYTAKSELINGCIKFSQKPVGRKAWDEEIQSDMNKQAKIFEADIYKQWPCESPTEPVNSELYGIYFHVPEAMDNIRAKFKGWHNNLLFFQWLGKMCDWLRQMSVSSTQLKSMEGSASPPAAWSVVRHITLGHLFSRANIPDSSKMDYAIQLPDILTQDDSSSGPHLVSALETRIAKLAKLPEETRYLEQLAGSVDQLGRNVQQPRLTAAGDELRKVLSNYHQSCLDRYNQMGKAFREALSFNNQKNLSSASIAEGTAVWPVVSGKDMVAQMNRMNWKHLSQGWRQAVVNIGCCLAQLQGAERLLQLHDQEADLIREISNLGPRSWDPMQHPESLLLEIESNIRIRDVQQKIAEAMEHPPDGEDKNVVMQLNMGEGKSSVIVPIVAAALGNGFRLVRIIVGKPQSRQMFEMLVSKLGGLIGRRVYHMPFSRNLRPTQTQAEFLERHYMKCRDRGGVLLLQPENILSLQLMVLETAIKEQTELASALLRMQVDLFDRFSRDIIDESDENFSVKFELIYTMGLQGPIDYAPERWILIQQVLGLVAKYAAKLAEQFSKSIEFCAATPGRYPRIRFLDNEASDAVLSLVVDHVCENGLLPGFPISRFNKALRDNIREYIIRPSPCPKAVANVEGSEFWATSFQSILVIRGLFAGSLLDFVFSKKRWRVNYGPDAMRQPKTRLAVPYRAKDSPSPRSEFSHPDVVICLTSISYYYGGLSDEEMFLSFAHLFKSDQAEGDYQNWIRAVETLPEAFKQLEGVNISDRQLCIHRVFPHLRYSKAVIDYFLSKILFVKEMKQFSHKLSASGWDLGRIKNLPATGFSGTNDSQHVLPLTVTQLNLQAQEHTNALVLENLLRLENSVVLLSGQEGHGAVWSAMQLLELTVQMEPETRVILDVGAQVLDMDNKDVASAWLNLVRDQSEIQAVVFCSDADELSVLDRQGQVERLQTSPFAKHLDTCLVFLDEAHTRGIDLKLPSNYQAAVTLGAHLVKDRLVQACMRMRKLGHGQSVVFYIPEEIETKIRALNNKSEIADNEPITVLDVLAWSISETWADIRRSLPIWANQGNTFARQQEYWKLVFRPDGEKVINKPLAERFLEDEAQNLDFRYRPQPHRANFIEDMAQSPDPLLQQISHKYRQFCGVDENIGSLQEEQERELAPEIEEQRQKEGVKPAIALKHMVDPDVRLFVVTGLIKASSKSFQKAFAIFADTSAADDFDVSQWPKGLLVTADFAKTVEVKPFKSFMDDFVRSAQWVLTSSASGQMTMVVVSPYEANMLRDEIAGSQAVVRHLYGARQNQGFAPIDRLGLYTLPGSALQQEIPKSLIIELNLFAGQLYFRSFQEYTEVCDYLGLTWKAVEEGQIVLPDGFIQRPANDKTCGFKESPVNFLKVILTKIRLNCEAMEKTHIGMMLNGALLTEDDFIYEHWGNDNEIPVVDTPSAAGGRVCSSL